MIKVSIEKYVELIENKKIKEAEKLRNEILPKKLYKYVSLDKNKSVNNSKIEGLADNEIWMSRVDFLNDPFEFKGIFLDKEKLKNMNCPDDTIKQFEYFFDKINKNYLITSLTNTVTNNMPMWAHYSNNHRGFCIEFEVLNNSKVYPVFYEEKRCGIALIINSYLNYIHDLNEENFEDRISDLKYFSYLFMIMGLAKHKTWSYENEYRVIMPSINNDKKGQKVYLEKLGLKINALFLGLNCEKDLEMKIRDKLSESSINIYKMKFKDESDDYRLYYEK